MTDIETPDDLVEHFESIAGWTQDAWIARVGTIARALDIPGDDADDVARAIAVHYERFEYQSPHDGAKLVKYHGYVADVAQTIVLDFESLSDDDSKLSAVEVKDVPSRYDELDALDWTDVYDVMDRLDKYDGFEFRRNTEHGDLLVKGGDV